MTYFLLLFGMSQYCPAQSQIAGLYTSQLESKTTYLKSKTLQLNSDNSFCITETRTNLEFEILQQTIHKTLGTFTAIDQDAVIIYADSIERRIVYFSKPKIEFDPKYIGSRKAAYFATDTTKLATSKYTGPPRVILYYKKMNSNYLCPMDSDSMFFKNQNTMNESNQLKNQRESIRGKHLHLCDLVKNVLIRIF